MQIAALLFLVAAATAAPYDPPSGNYWDRDDYELPDGYTDPDSAPFGQFGWFKGGPANVFGAEGQLLPDRAADWDDSFVGREKAHISGFVQDHLADAANFLAEQGDDDFDFGEWYNEQLENFKYDQEDIDYDNAHDKKEDMDDFKDHLDEIAYEFRESQNHDYNDFVSDTVNDVWGKALDESQDIIERLRETGWELNENEHRAGELYAELLEIGCGANNADDSYLPNDYDVNYDYHQPMLGLVDVTAEFDWADVDQFPGTADYFGETSDSPYQCKMSQIFWEYVENAQELNGEYNGGHLTTKRRHNLENKQIDLKRAFASLRRKWRSLRKELDEAEQNADHERQEIDHYNKILANLLTVDSNYDGPLGGVAIADGAKAARPRKLDGTWNPHEVIDFDWNSLYGSD